jgi:hypothetical protein
MFRVKKPQFKFKTYKSDAAPFFFFIDIYPLDLRHFNNPLSTLLAKHIINNPIMPLPMRVDRVFNGDASIIIRPNLPVSFPLNETTLAVVNPTPFLQLGIENLLFFTEIRSQENLARPLDHEKAHQWWENTENLYGNLRQLEEDFSAFLKAYLYTIIKATINEEDLTSAAIKYCEIINDICNEKMVRNKILEETAEHQEYVRMYKEKIAKSREKLKIVKNVQYHPELIDIEVYDFQMSGFPNQEVFKNLRKESFDCNVSKYIPLLLYDDLQECMLQNLELLEENEKDLLNPKALLEKNVISLLQSEELESLDLSDFSWLTNLKKVNIEVILQSLYGSS